MSLRSRLVLVTILIGGIGLLGLNAAVFRFVHHEQYARLDRQLRDVGFRFGLFRDVIGPRGVGPGRARPDGPGFDRPVLEQPGPVRPGPEQPGPVRPGPGRPVADRVGPERPVPDRADRVERPGSALGPGRLPPPGVAPFRRGAGRGLPAGELYVELRNTAGKRLAPARTISLDGSAKVVLDLPARLPPATAEGTTFTTRGSGGSASHYRVSHRSVQLPDGRSFHVLSALPTTELDSTLERLRQIQWMVTAAVLAAFAVAVWLVVRLSLRRLLHIEHAAETISAGDFSHRIADENPRTETGRLGASLNRMMAQIENAFLQKDESQAQLRRFVADASHELRTPLTAIQGYTQLLRRRRHDAGTESSRSDPETDQMLTRVEDAAIRMANIVEDLLSLARLEQRDAIPHDPVVLDDVVRHVVDDIVAGRPGRTITLTVGSSSGSNGAGSIVVAGDRHRLHQAIANLIENATVHTPPDTPIEVRLARSDGNAIVTVTDHGPGIAAEHLAHLFEPFYRVDPGRSRRSGGTGLGLAIADAIVRAHGGQLSVTSTEGVGTTFTVTLPEGGQTEGEGSDG